MVEALEKKSPAVLSLDTSEGSEQEVISVPVDKHVAELKKADAKHKLVKAHA